MNHANPGSVTSPAGRTSSAASPSYRLGAALIAAGCLAVLAAARFVVPTPSGVGSHCQLGLAPCGFYERTGYPCPTCGMTTAFAYMVRGQIVRSFITQPAGALAALACTALGLAAAFGAVTGSRFDRIIITIEFYWLRIALLITFVVLLSWVWTCIKIKMQNT